MILKCRSCGSEDIKNVLSLGFTPLANALLTADQLLDPEEKFPLDLVFCQECTLVQIVETVPPEKLFSQYFYTSSISTTVLENARDIANRMINRMKLDEKSVVVEIGSNDGYLLKNYVEKGIPVWGIEPAKNLAELANKNGVRTTCAFFNEKQAKTFVGSGDSTKGWNIKADVVHANNVLAHVADLHGVVEGIKILLKDDGVVVIETHYVKDLIESCQFDCIYHEHLCYYSVYSLVKLFQAHGMDVVDVERIPIHGGSLRVYFQKFGGKIGGQAESKERIEEILHAEHESGMSLIDFYQGFGADVMFLKEDVLNLLRDLRSQDKRVAIYGASAKSTTLLNFFGIDNKLIDFVVDDTPEKQGHFTPGTYLPICRPGKLIEEMPEYTLILTWNFAKEIMEKNQAYKEKGGKFIIPTPKIEIV